MRRPPPRRLHWRNPAHPPAPVPALLRSEDEDDGEEDEDGMDDEDGLQDTEEDFEGDATEPEY